MKKRDKIILIVIACVLVVSTGLLLAFFLNKGESIAAAENDYQGIYNAYSSYEHDSFMKIDGQLDEEQWQNKTWHYNTGYTREEGEFPSYETTAVLTEKGVYIACKVKDSNIIYNGQKNMKKNSNFYLRVTAYKDGEAIGSKNDYQKATYIDMGCGIKSFTDVDRAVVVEGVLNSGDTVGATLETFFAWECLNINPAEGIPTEVGILPEYYAVLPGKESVSYISTSGVGVGYNSEATFMFDANGFCNADKDGAMVGDAINGSSKTPGWDLSKVQEGVVQSTSHSAIELLFFKDMFAKNMIMETTIIPAGDDTIYSSLTRAGFAFMTEGGVYGTATAIMKNKADCSYDTGIFTKIRLHTRIPSGTVINTTHSRTAYTNESDKPGVQLTVIKFGDTYIYFMDGNYMGSEKMPSCAAEIYPALFTAGANAIFKNFSCKEITEQDMVDYLNKHNMYRIQAELASGGGSVTASETFIKKGGSVDVEIVTNNGYELESVLVNDKERMSVLKKTAVDGTFTLENVTANQVVKVKFAKYSGEKQKLKVSATAEKGYSAKVYITSKSNGLLSYRADLLSDKETVVEVPSGSYSVTIIAEGYVAYTTQVNLNKERTVTAKLTASNFPEKITVNEVELVSNRDKFDLSKEANGKVSTSYDADGKLAPLYFSATAKNFVVTTELAYTTNFKTGVDYQPDLMGGFFVHDGTNNAWVVAWKDGIRYPGHQTSSSRQVGMSSVTCLLYPEPLSVKFTMVKYGEKVYFYFNDIYGGEMAYTELGKNLDPNKEVAIGLTMMADKSADIQFSNYSLKTGDAAAKKYIDDHNPDNVVSKKLSANPLFAEYNRLGTKTYGSAFTKFNVTSSIVSGSYAKGTPKQNLWFYSEKGTTTALISAKIRYSSDFKAGIDYQSDLFGGFCVGSETSSGWIMANQTGTHITGSERNRGLVTDKVLCWDGTTTPKDVTLTLAVRDRYIYVYFDGVFAIRYTKSHIVEGADTTTNLIFGLRMNSDKAADIEYSDITYTEDAKKVDEYISAHK